MQKQDSLKKLTHTLVNAPLAEQRLEACRTFVPQLVEALKVKGSFYFQFDSLREISVVYPPDSSFRIFTWALAGDMGTYRYYGTLQQRTANNTLRMFPFFDHSVNTAQAADTITGPNAWVGALYYKMIKTEYKGKTYYTLFGWQGNNMRSNKKILEALSFRNGQPVFGAPVFHYQRDSLPAATYNRFILEYKEDGNAGLNYDPDMHMILYDHLQSLNKTPERKYTLVPDGTYEGFKWQNGMWVHVDKVFNEVSKKPPVPAPLKFRRQVTDTTEAGQ
ncbi:hypothetical protein [Compostibacter hankyongensis]|uniref:Uncharacterized protein n=1 Tax=Compostibacter hankyongensis TaxID=1007089 RepID=A0ABP8FPQ6_9BACT